MYAIYADGVCIYNDAFALDSTKVLNPKLTLEDNAAGSLTMTLPPQNVGYNSIERLKTDISVRKNGEEIWAGRVLQEDKDFYNNRILYCEGELAFFNDSTQPPEEYKGLSIRGYLEKLIAVHNSKVPENRRFAIGAVAVEDKNYPTYYTNYEKTIADLNALVEEYGGHFWIRKEGGKRYLDYLKGYHNVCSQVIQFGSNLLDFVRKWDSTEFATVIVPLGARLDDSPIKALDAYLTVESVNQGSIYVQSDTAVAAYGWIEKTVTWDNVTNPEVLLEKAKVYLTELQFDNMELELSALDLHYLDVNYEAVKLLDQIRVVSRPHGLDRLFPVTKLEIPLDNPDQTQFKMGDTVQTSLTSVNNQISAAILKKIEGLPKAHSILDEAKENADAIMNTATNGYITIVKNEGGTGTEELYISNTPDYKTATRYWRWNINGLAYYDKENQDFNNPSDLKLALTMDGKICADFITTGVLNADIIRAGTLKDVEGKNFSLDLKTGELVMKKGSIKLGSYSSGHYDFEVDNEGNLYARNGTFAGKLVGASGTFGGTLYAAKIYGDLVGTDVDPNDASKKKETWLRGCGISVGGDDYATGKGNFYVDTAGNVTMNGSISLTGSITWGVGNSPCQILYGRLAFGTPSGKYSDFYSNDANWWHKNFDSFYDYYASYTYDGGVSWTSAIQIRGIDGQNGTDGRDGVNGSDAEVTRQNIYRAMLNAMPNDGLYSLNGDLLIHASAIKSGTIDAGAVYLANDDAGGFKAANGFDGRFTTYGAMMYGSSKRNYVIATNGGVRMTASDGDSENAIFVMPTGCHATEEIITGSDRRIKNTISYDMDKYSNFFENLKPTSFCLNRGNSGRFHIGFIAQDVRDALTNAGLDTKDFAGFVQSSGEGDVRGEYEDQCYLRYDNFIALNTFAIQSAWKEIRLLKAKIQKLEGRSDTSHE